jgi:hypothetical protein
LFGSMERLKSKERDESVDGWFGRLFRGAQSTKDV